MRLSSSWKKPEEGYLSQREKRKGKKKKKNHRDKNKDRWRKRKAISVFGLYDQN